MAKTLAKSIMIILLLALTTYQIILLWFDYPSDRNFFYNVLMDQANVSQNQPQPSLALFTGVEVGVYDGPNSGTYRMITKNEFVDGELAENSLKLLKEAFENGAGLESMEKEDLYLEKHILFVMPVTLGYDVVVEDFLVEPSYLDEAFAFSRLYIFPGDGGDANIEIVFSDERLEKIYGCQVSVLNNKSLNESLVQYLDGSKIFGSGVNYISTVNSELTLFEEDVLLPAYGQYLDYLKSIQGRLQFMDESGISTRLLEEFIGYFLVNPENTWNTTDESSVSYGDYDSKVSYDMKGVFQYALIEPQVDLYTNVGSAYDAAVDFLEKDSLLSDGSYVLEDYLYDETGVTFYYNYVYEDMKVMIGDCQQLYDMPYPMQIRVQNNRVVEYKRVLLTFDAIDEDTLPYEVRFLNPLDSLLVVNELQSIRRMDLAYYLDEDLEQLPLMWVVEAGEVRYYIELE